MKTHPAKAVHTKQAQILFIEDGRVRNIGGHHHMAMVDMTESVQPIDAVQLNGVWYKLADATEADQFQAAWENPVRVAPGEAGHIDSAKFCTLQGVSEKALTPYSYDFNPSDAAFIAKVKDIVGETIPCDTSAAAGIQAALERAKDDVPAALDPLLHSKNPIKRAAAEFRRDVLPPVPEIPDPLEDKTVVAALRTGVESQRESRSPVGTLQKAENQCNCGHCLYCLFHFFGLTPYSSTIADIIRSVKDVVSPAPTTPSSASDLRDIVSRIKAKNVGLRLLGFGAPLDTADEMKQILFSYPTLLAFVKRVDRILTGTVQPAGCTCGACWHCLMAEHPLDAATIQRVKEKVEADKAKPAVSPPVLNSAITDAQWQCLMSLDAAMRLAPLEISEDCHAPAVSFVRRAGRLSIVFSRGYLRRLQSIDNKPSGIA